MASPSNHRFAVAVHVLTYLASQPEATFGSDALARSTQVNPVHVRKLLGPLRSAGMVTSRPGARGGWQLARPAAAITLADVWEVLHGGDAVLGRHVPSQECPVGHAIQSELDALDRELTDAITDRLRRTTVADLVTPAMTATGA